MSTIRIQKDHNHHSLIRIRAGYGEVIKDRLIKLGDFFVWDYNNEKVVSVETVKEVVNKYPFFKELQIEITGTDLVKQLFVDGERAEYSL